MFHISHLEEKDLAREMMEEQVSNKWPGLVEEVKELCETMRIEDPRMTEKGRRAYNEMVKEACRWKDEAMMKEEMGKMKDKKLRTMYTPCLKLGIDPKIPHLPGFEDIFLLPKLGHPESFINIH